MKIITIAGNVGKDAVVRRTGNGDAVAGFSVAVTDRKKDTTWFDVSVWGKRGETLAQYIRKGSKVTVIGELSTREHEGKTYLSVNASEIALQDSRTAGDEYRDKQPTGQGENYDMRDAEIPFMMEWR